ncbi:MAG: iron-containing alcohol dehydrogenase [Holophagales bacterium]|nr:iron-containing alcohol dehydrogenase [Holophagales bacterium]
MSYATLPEGHWAADLGGVHVEFGAGGLDRLGRHVLSLVRRGDAPPIRRPLVVTDPGLVAAGHADRAVAALESAGFGVAVFDGVRENPTTEHVEQGVEAARRHGADLLVGLGGGSAMDCAKGINFLFTNGGRMEDYRGVDRAEKPMLPSIGIPTTGGTGSEAQRFALVSRPDSHMKMACGDRKARFRTVVLDPDLLATVPRSVAAVSGMDALSHAVESYVTTRRNPISQLFAREAWCLLERAFETYLDHPDDAAARGDMLLGSHLSGAAIETSMLGVAHSCANPLTAHYGVVHGAAVGLMLPHVVRWNGAEVFQLYGDLTAAAGLNGHGPREAPEHLGRRLEELRRAADLPSRLSEAGVERSQLALLASEAAEQWTARFNPRPAASSDLQALYEAAF